jgi:hypothetical protein
MLKALMPSKITDIDSEFLNTLVEGSETLQDITDQSPVRAAHEEFQDIFLLGAGEDKFQNHLGLYLLSLLIDPT